MGMQIELLRRLAWDMEERLTVCPAVSWAEFEGILAGWLQTFAPQFSLQEEDTLIARVIAPVSANRQMGDPAQERWYAICRTVPERSDPWRFLPLTDEDLRIHQAGVAMAMANVYDAGYEEEARRNRQDLARRLETLRHGAG